MTPAQLRALPGWTETPEGEATALCRMGAERWARPGGSLLEVGKSCLGPMLIVSGQVQLLFEVADFGMPLAVLGPGDWLSVDSAHHTHMSSLSARALTEAKAFQVPREQIEQVRQRPSPTGLRLLRAMLAAQVKLDANLAPHVAAWMRQLAAKRKLTKQDLLDLGMSKLVASTTVTAEQAVKDGRAVEVVTHEGAPIAASFRQIR